MTDFNCKQPKPCQPPPKDEPKPCSPAFELCTGDRTLKWDGFCLTLDRTRNTPDGTYTSVTVVDGCIVGYGYADEPTYTPPYCNPNPTPCQGQGGATDPTIAPSADNSLVNSASGLFARTFVQGGDNIAVSGKGTVQNPYIVKFAGSVAKTTVIGEAGVTHRESDGITYVGLAPTGIQQGIYNGFSINAYGQIVGVSNTIATDSASVKAGAGLTATTDGEVTTIGHEERDIVQSATFGAFTVVLDKSGHIVDLDRIATVTAGTYSIGAYNVAINEFGTIHTITQNAEVPDAEGTFTTSDNKVVSYDATGRITDVTSADTTNELLITAPRAIRDMYKFEVLGNQIKKEAYGNDVNILNATSTAFDVQLPVYVLSVTQVQVNGAISHTLKGNMLTITHTGALASPSNKVITVAIRS